MRGEKAPPPSEGTLSIWHSAQTAGPQTPIARLLTDFAQANLLVARPEQARRNRSAAAKFCEEAGIALPDHITVEKIEGHLQALLADGLSPKTVRNHLGAIGAFCRFLKKRRFLQFNPARDADRPRCTRCLPNFLTRRQWEQALRIARRHRIYCEVCLALNTGMRMSELRFLKWSDVSLPERYLLIRKSKSRRPRRIWLNEVAVAALAKQQRRYGRLEYVFPGGHSRRAGRPVWDRNTARGRDWWVKSALLPLQKAIPAFGKLHPGSVGRGWHLLRHSFASRAVQRGIRIYKVSQWLGHASVLTTQIYAHLAPGFDDDIEKLV